MLKLKVQELGSGTHPSEKIVEIVAKDSVEQVVVDKSLVTENYIKVSPMSKVNGHQLVELPRETMRGLWRIWVSDTEIIKSGA